jgi:prepilin-type N-terminal cleavage/methylation domain-containing protein
MKRSKPAFTLIELLVVIAIIALLLGILIPALKKVKDIAAMKICQNNTRQIAIAVNSYADDHEQVLPNGNTGLPTNYPWVCDPLQEDEKTAEVSPFTLEGRLRGIRAGTLWPYLQNIDVYHCPKDNRSKTLRGGYRTYSLPYSINCGVNHSWYGYTAKKVSELRNPSIRLMAMEEGDPRGYNMGSWVLLGTHPSGQPGGATAPNFSDPIAYWHANGCVIAYADSHAEPYLFKELDTLKWLQWNEQRALEGYQTIIWYTQTPGILKKDCSLNEDWQFFLRIYTF